VYAADRTIRRLLPLLDIEARLPDFPFNEEAQVQPSSIDLRLDTRFWVGRRISRPLGWRFWRRSVLDLRNRQLQEIAPRRHWRRVELRSGESIDLKPGEMLLGRTYERFTIPLDYAGKIEGRSSYARLGLMVHCTGDFINPGYRGHMPLEMVSFARSVVRLTPLTPIAQLILVKLTEEPERHYGHEGLESKYLEDDGGPSYWWRDKLFASIAHSIGGHNINPSISERIAELIAPDVGVESLERLDRYIRSRPVGEVESGEELMTGFARTEDRRSKISQMLRRSTVSVAGILISAAIAALFVHPIGWGHIVLWAGALLSLGASGFAYWYRADEYYGMAELKTHQSRLAAAAQA